MLKTDPAAALEELKKMELSRMQVQLEIQNLCRIRDEIDTEDMY